jgi:DNA-directed RNA polymerase specialized sigma24 family protein
VGDTAITKAELKRDWASTESAFHQFLSWLDEGVDSGGEKYLEMRRRLVCYFDRKKCPSPDELADESLNRVARRLEEEGGVIDSPPARYCYIVAKFVFLEYLRRAEHGHVSLDERSTAASLQVFSEFDDTQDYREKLLDCLEHCLRNLHPTARALIFDYYRDEQHNKIESRKALAAKLGVTMNALSIRACRIRDKLEDCVSECCAEG